MTLQSTLTWLRKNRIAVLKGGWSRERAISLKTGAAVEKALKSLNLAFTSVDVQPSFGEQLRKRKWPFALICLHGTFGEDGQIQSLLDQYHIPYSGSGALASSLAMNKASAKVLFQENGLPTAKWILISQSHFKKHPSEALQPALHLLSKTPVFVKPVDQGSAIGISQVKRKSDIQTALHSCFRFSDQALVEEWVQGRELTVGILGNKTLPVVEIIPQHAFYDYHSKYAKGGSRHIVPAPLSSATERKLKKCAYRAFQALGCSVYGRVDFLMRKNGTFVVLEVNTIPGMTEVSLLPEAAQAQGLRFEDLILSIVRLSLLKKRSL